MQESGMKNMNMPNMSKTRNINNNKKNYTNIRSTQCMRPMKKNDSTKNQNIIKKNKGKHNKKNKIKVKNKNKKETTNKK